MPRSFQFKIISGWEKKPVYYKFSCILAFEGWKKISFLKKKTFSIFDFLGRKLKLDYVIDPKHQNASSFFPKKFIWA